MNSDHCVHKSLAQHVDGIIKVDSLLHGIKPNATVGRPKHNKAALQMQPADAQADAALSNKPIVVVSQDFTRARQRGTKRPTGKQYIGRKVAKLYKNGGSGLKLWVGTVTSSKQSKGSKELTYRVLWADGTDEDLSATALGQAMGMYRLAKQNHDEKLKDKENIDESEESEASGIDLDFDDQLEIVV